jgi:hypothetical protein
VKHGDPTHKIHLGTYLGPDPELAFVHADPAAYAAARPCRCAEQGEPCDNCNPITEERAAA